MDLAHPNPLSSLPCLASLLHTFTACLKRATVWQKHVQIKLMGNMYGFRTTCSKKRIAYWLACDFHTPYLNKLLFLFCVCCVSHTSSTLAPALADISASRISLQKLGIGTCQSCVVLQTEALQKHQCPSCRWFKKSQPATTGLPASLFSLASYKDGRAI